jgi:hypothetical protein
LPNLQGLAKFETAGKVCGESASANGLELFLGYFSLPNPKGLAKKNSKENWFAKGERLFRTFVT